MAELGIDVIDKQITALTEQAAVLQRKKQQLGFDTYGGLRGKAQLLLEGKMSKTSEAKSLHQLRDELVGKMLLVKTVAEAEALLVIAKSS